MSAERPPPPPKPGQVLVVKALYDYKAQDTDEISFDSGDILYIIDNSNKDWFTARCGSSVGLIPSNYVEQQMEAVPQPMHSACQYGNVAFLAELINNKVSVNGLDAAGNTPLHWACRGGHIQCVSMLMNSSCDLAVQNKAGDTPLHLAAWKNHADVVELLLSNARLSPSNAALKNRRGETPLSLAKEPEARALLSRAARASQDANANANAAAAAEAGYSDSDQGEDSD